MTSLSDVYFSLYRWTDKAILPIVWSSAKARDRLLQRMIKSTGNEATLAVSCSLARFRIEYPAASERLLAGWAESARKTGAVLGVGLGAL